MQMLPAHFAEWNNALVRGPLLFLLWRAVGDWGAAAGAIAEEAITVGGR